MWLCCEAKGSLCSKGSSAHDDNVLLWEPTLPHVSSEAPPISSQLCLVCLDYQWTPRGTGRHRTWGQGDLTHHPRLVTEVVNGFQWVDAGEACILHANNQVPEVLILCHAKGMLPDKHKVWPERPGKNVEASFPSTSTSSASHLLISKALDREGIFGATWCKPFILLLLFFHGLGSELLWYSKEIKEQVSEVPLFFWLKHCLFLRYKFPQERRNTFRLIHLKWTRMWGNVRAEARCGFRVHAPKGSPQTLKTTYLADFTTLPERSLISVPYSDCLKLLLKIGNALIRPPGE